MKRSRTTRHSATRGPQFQAGALVVALAVAGFALPGCEGGRKGAAPAPPSPTQPAAGANTGAPSAAESAAKVLQGDQGYSVVDVANPGKLEVTALFRGDPIPETTEVPVNIDVETCGKKVFAESVLVDKESRGLANVVVRLEGISSGKAPPPLVQLTNKDCAFVPHVGVAVQGSSLQLSNNDPVLHTTRSVLDERQLFNTSLRPGGPPQRPRKLRRAGLVDVKCDVHKWMQGYIMIHSNPYIAVSDSSGKLSIDGIPPGDYPYVAWHEQLGEQTGSVKVRAGETAGLELEFSRQEG